MHSRSDRLNYRVLALAMPVLAEQLLAVAVGMVDTWLTGNYLPGDEYLAAIGQMAYLMWLIPSLFAFVSIGTTALVARSIGADDSKTANRAANQSIVMRLRMACHGASVWIVLLLFLQFHIRDGLQQVDQTRFGQVAVPPHEYFIKAQQAIVSHPAGNVFHEFITSSVAENGSETHSGRFIEDHR